MNDATRTSKEQRLEAIRRELMCGNVAAVEVLRLRDEIARLSLEPSGGLTAPMCPECGWVGEFRAAPPPAATRTNEDYAIEHGRYLANAAENFLKALGEYELAVEDEADADSEEDRDGAAIKVRDASEARGDSWRRLESTIHEFRKRADRARPPVTKSAQSNTSGDAGNQAGWDRGGGASDSSSGETHPAELSCLRGGTKHCPYFKPGHPCCDCGASAHEKADAPSHVCGLQGFNPMRGDTCPACDARPVKKGGPDYAARFRK